jgi:hypothetical protein
MSTAQWKKLKTIFERAKSGDAEAVHRPRHKPPGATIRRKRMNDTSPFLGAILGRCRGVLAMLPACS